MQTPDIPQFMAILAGIGELYGKTISEALTDIYWQALKSFEFEDVQQAFQAHIHNPECGQFFPKPADIVRFIEGCGETQALQAWAKVERAITEVGVYQSLVFDDPLIHAVLEDMGGWIKLCSTTNEALPFYANEFRKRYMGFVIRKPKRYPKYLYGLCELENTNNGFEVKPPVLIGNTTKAIEVLKTGGGTPLLIEPLEKSLAQAVLEISRSKSGPSDD